MSTTEKMDDDDLVTASSSTSALSDEVGTSSHLSGLLSKYFEDCDSQEQRILAKCRCCGSKIKASTQASSNLLTHLKRCDSERYFEYVEEKKTLL